MVANDSNSYDAATATLAVKSTDVTIDKDVTGASDDSDATDAYKLGDWVPFTITTAFPAYPTNSTYATFVISDESTGLTFDASKDVTVKVDGTAVEAGESTYELTVTASKLTITFAQEYIIANATKAVEVSYTAQITDADAASATAGQYKNDATLTYNPNPYTDTTNEVEDIVTGTTYGYVFNKVGKDSAESETSTALEGATFTLYADNSGAKGSAITDADGNERTSTSTIVSGVAYVYFDGLAAGTYWVSETTVPAGYVGAEDFSFTVSASTATADNPATTATAESDYLVNATPVENIKGVTLPSTGGTGTTVLYVAGGIMVLIAGVFLVSRRRASKMDYDEMM